MKTTLTLLAVVLIALVGYAAAPHAGDASETSTGAEPTADEQVAALEEMCTASAEARTARQEEKSLYERLGGEEKIHEMVAEIVRLHQENEDLDYIMEGVDIDKLVDGVTVFFAAGTGGDAKYDGPSLTDSHEHMKLTNALFLSAGGDVVQGMKNTGMGEDEINEMMCIFMSLRSQVVLPDGHDHSEHKGHGH